MTAEESLLMLMQRKHFNMAFPTKMFSRSLAGELRFPEDGKFDDIALMHKLLASAGLVAYHGLPKYTFYRHDGNNSAWTTNHCLLTPDILAEYMGIYSKRTEWLSERFPDSAAAFRYYKWSFMVSMVEKIIRIGIEGCSWHLDALVKELKDNKQEFLRCGYTMDFEKEWFGKYVENI
jgi:hypothetical protein